MISISCWEWLTDSHDCGWWWVSAALQFGLGMGPLILQILPFHPPPMYQNNPPLYPALEPIDGNRILHLNDMD